MHERGEKVSLDLKPSVCGAVMHMTKDGKRIVVDMNEGADWRAGRLGKFIYDTSMKLEVLIRMRARLIIVYKNEVLSDFVDDRLMSDAGVVNIELPDTTSELYGAKL